MDKNLSQGSDRLAAFFTAILILFVVNTSTAQTKDYRFHKVFFYSFTKYIDWPQEKKEGDFVIGIVGESSIIPLLEEMAEIKKVGNRPIKVRKIDKVSANDYFHILFIPSPANAQFAEIKNTLGQKPALLVTEVEGMAREGAMINFKDVNGKLRFEVNTATLENSGLKMSQELMRFGEEIN